MSQSTAAKNSTPRGTSTFSAPDEEFPPALDALTVVESHVLPSRICRQLDHEYLTDPTRAHPATLDRHQELAAELHHWERSSARTHPTL